MIRQKISDEENKKKRKKGKKKGRKNDNSKNNAVNATQGSNCCLLHQPISTLGGNAVCFIDVKHDGTYNNHWTSNGFKIANVTL